MQEIAPGSIPFRLCEDNAPDLLRKGAWILSTARVQRGPSQAARCARCATRATVFNVKPTVEHPCATAFGLSSWR